MANYEADFHFNRNTMDFNCELAKNSIQADLILQYKPDKLSQLYNDVGFITKEVDNLTFYMKASDIRTALDTKVDKITGKGLSTNDFTGAYKTKLEGIESGAQVNTVTSVNGQIGDVEIVIPDSVSFRNLTGSPYDNANLAFELNSKQPNINDLDTIRTGASKGATALQPNNNISRLHNDVGYITSASLPTKLSDLTNDTGFITATALIPIENNMIEIENDVVTLQNNKVDKVTGKGLSTNDFSNSYKSKLEGIEAGAQVNKVNSVNGQVGNVTITIPTKTSDLTNDSNFATVSQIPTNNNQLVNGAGYITTASLPTKLSDLTNDTGFITNSVNNLTNYYLKTETYTKQEVNQLIANIPKFEIQIVQALPQTGEAMVLYLVPKVSTAPDVYDEYIWIETSESFELIGSTAVDLTGYATEQWVQNQGYIDDISGLVPYSSATSTVDLNGQDLKNVDNLAVGTSTIDSNEKILSVGQNRIVTNNNNGLFISSTTSQTRKGMYGVPMALEIQFNSNNQAYSYPLGFHDMNSNGQGGQFLFTSFSSAISAASAGDVMVENDKGGLIFNAGASKTGSKMRFTVGNWASTPQLTLTANGVGIKNLNPNSSYALDVTGIINASSDVRVNGVSVALPSQSGNSGKFLTTNGSTASWAEISTNANVQYVSGGGGSEDVDLSGLYIDSQGATYSFYYDYDYGTIRNNNQQVDESFAYAMIELYIENDGDITISFRQSSEQNYDFGEISELDSYLNQDQYEDTDYVAWSGKEYSDIEDSITFSNVLAGYHYFTVKYIKDSSSESGEDLFEITAITLGSGSGGGSLIDTDTQEEIPLSQINDMPQALQSIIDQIPDISDLSNDYVTMNTSQKIQAAKAIFGTDVAFGSDTTQKNLLAVISNSNSTSGNWIGRLCVGAKNKTFIMGTYGSICVLGAHAWTNAQQGTGAAWEDVYINPDGNKAVYIGGSPINGKQAILKIQNVNVNTTGTVQINRSSNLTNNFKDVACWDDDVRKFSFTSISGYSASANQVLQHDTSGNLKWVNV